MTKEEVLIALKEKAQPDNLQGMARFGMNIQMRLGVAVPEMRQLAKKIGKTSITISDYEKGKSTPPIDVALKLCEIFGVDLNDLVSRNLQKEDFLSTGLPGNSIAEPDLNKEYELLRQLSQLQGHRLGGCGCGWGSRSGCSQQTDLHLEWGIIRVQRRPE